MVVLGQTMHLSCTDTNTVSKMPKQDSPWPTSPRSSIGCIQNNLLGLWYVRHKQCTYLVSILALSTKRTKTSFHLCLITSEYHRVRPKRLLSLWYVQRKQCTYLASRLELTPNGLKRGSTCASSPRYIQVRPKRLLILWYVWCKPCSYLTPTLTSSPNRPKQDMTWPMLHMSSIGCVQNDFEPMARSA
jgi:hypothetical protein